MLEQYTWLGRWVEGEKGHNANSASVEEVLVKVEAELGNLNNFGLVNVTGLGGNINHHNPVEVKCQVGIIESNTNPKFKLFRVGGWVGGWLGQVEI